MTDQALWWAATAKLCWPLLKVLASATIAVPVAERNSSSWRNTIMQPVSQQCSQENLGPELTPELLSVGDFAANRAAKLAADLEPNDGAFILLGNAPTDELHFIRWAADLGYREGKEVPDAKR